MKTVTYPVSASSFEALVASLEGKVLVDGRPTIASTRIAFEPTVSYAEGEGECTIRDAEVRVRASVTLPIWRQYRFVRPDERAAWDRMMERLRRHEDLHVAIAVEHAGELVDTLYALPSAPTCGALDEHVAAVQAEMLARHRRAQDDFDDRSPNP